jgi:hypothetical protein
MPNWRRELARKEMYAQCSACNSGYFFNLSPSLTCRYCAATGVPPSAEVVEGGCVRTEYTCLACARIFARISLVARACPRPQCDGLCTPLARLTHVMGVTAARCAHCNKSSYERLGCIGSDVACRVCTAPRRFTPATVVCSEYKLRAARQVMRHHGSIDLVAAIESAQHLGR